MINKASFLYFMASVRLRTIFPTCFRVIFKFYFIEVQLIYNIAFNFCSTAKLLSYTRISSVTQSCLTLCDPMDCSTRGFPVHHQHSELAQAHVHRVSDAIQPSHPLSSSSPPTFNLSQHQGLFSESVLCIRLSKYCTFSFSISSLNEYSGLISFRMDWLDLLAVQGTLKSLLQHHSSKASILWHSPLYSPTLTSILPEWWVGPKIQGFSPNSSFYR